MKLRRNASWVMTQADNSPTEERREFVRGVGALAASAVALGD